MPGFRPLGGLTLTPLGRSAIGAAEGVGEAARSEQGGVALLGLGLDQLAGSLGGALHPGMGVVLRRWGVLAGAPEQALGRARQAQAVGVGGLLHLGPGPVAPVAT